MADRRAGRAVPRAFVTRDLAVRGGGGNPGDPAVSDASAAPVIPECLPPLSPFPLLFH